MSGFTRFITPFSTALDTAGVTLPGAKLYFYLSETATPQATYSDADRAIPNTNPVIADAAGLFSNIYLSDGVVYKAILTDQDGNQVWTADPVTNGVSLAAINVTIPTIAALRTAAVTNTIENLLVYVRGYYSDNDGGGGFFQVVNTSPGADNGGTIIWSNTAGFYYVRQTYGAPYSVKWFGAKGDSIADDTTMLQTAITAVVTMGGGELWWPPGTYRTTASLTVAGAISMVGDGTPGRWIFTGGASTGGAAVRLDSSPSDRFDPGSFVFQWNIGSIGSEGYAQGSIENLGIGWTGAHAGGVYGIGLANLRITGNWLTGGMTNFGGDPASPGYPTGAITIDGFGMLFKDGITSQITGNQFFCVGFGIVANEIFNENVVSANSFVNVQYAAIMMRGGQSIRNTMAANNVTYARYGYYITGDTQNVTIDGGTLENCSNGGVIVTPTDYFTGTPGTAPLGIQIMGATFVAFGADWGVGAVSTACIGLKCDGAAVSTCTNHGPTANCTGLVSVANSSTTISVWGNPNLGGKPLFSPGSDLGDTRLLDNFRNGTATDSLTPDVYGLGVLLVSPTAPRSITNFTNGQPGQRLTVFNQSMQPYTLVHDGANFLLQGSANVVLTTTGYAVTLVSLDGVGWVQDGLRTP